MTPSHRITLRGPFPRQQLDRLLRELAPLSRLTEPSHLVVDLTGLARIDASSLAVLVSALHDVAERDLITDESTILAPKNWLVARWLERMDVIRLLAGAAAPVEEFVRREDHAFCPCQTFTSLDELAALATRLTGALSEAVQTDAASRFATYFALNEIAENVIEHARSSIGAIALAQVAPKRNEFIVAIADRGIGVRASLTQNPAYGGITDDLDALQLAEKRGISSKTAPMPASACF